MANNQSGSKSKNKSNTLGVNEPHDEFKFHVVESEIKEHKNIEYYVAGIGLAIIGLCLFIGIENNKDNRLFNLLLLSGSLSLLLGASNIVLEYAVRLAKILGVSELVIGLTLVSIGTSIPEIFTSIIAAREGAGGLAIGDIYGSYISQLTLFLGIVILLAPRTVESSFLPHVKRDAGLMIIALLILSINIADGQFTRLEATISILIFSAYTLFLYINARKNPEEREERIYTIKEMESELGIHLPQSEGHSPEISNYLKDQMQKEPTIDENLDRPSNIKIAEYFFFLAIGIALTYIGAMFVVEAGANIARTYNISEHVIGATIIGFGTGIPELVVSVMAIRKKKPDIAYGNLLGSNIVDPLFSGSIGALVSPIFLSEESVSGILWVTFPIAVLVGSFIIGIFSRTHCKRWQGLLFGWILVITYFVFIYLSIFYG